MNEISLWINVLFVSIFVAPALAGAYVLSLAALNRHASKRQLILLAIGSGPLAWLFVLTMACVSLLFKLGEVVLDFERFTYKWILRRRSSTLEQ